MGHVRENMVWLEQETGKQFGGAGSPLLVSVRSGSAMSMPGMMDTILNLGLNETTLAGLIKQTGNERFGYDAYRRFIQLFGKIALGIDDHHFDEHFEAIKRRAGVKVDLGLSANDLKEIGQLFLEVVQKETGRPCPERNRPAVPAGSLRATGVGRQGRVQLLDGPACGRLPPRVQDYPRDGQRYGGQCRDHGVWQHG